MNTANENDVPKIIRAMDEEFMRLIAARDFKQLTTKFYAEDAQFLPPDLGKGMQASGTVVAKDYRVWKTIG